MSASDGERIAPVTYLFGAQRSQQAPEPSPSEATPAEPAVTGLETPRDSKPGRFLPINNVSMNALARRGMSTEEMRIFLLGREFDAAEVEVEVERLLGVALLDDFALAETLVRTLRDRKGLGRSAITSELRRRKVDQSAISSALDEVDDDELARATVLAEKRAPQLRSLDTETAKRRLGGFLMRKGYSGSVVSTAVARALTPSGPVFR